MPASQWIIESTDDTFERDVVERSRSLPVVVDFWAPWCGPCRALAPVLEKLAHELAGKFLLAKVNIDQAQGLAAAFGVQSIPMVVALRDGQLVDGFMGALPEAAVREWLGRVLPSPVEELMQQARGVEATDPAQAEELYRKAMSLDPASSAPTIALASVLLNQGKLDESAQLIAQLEQRGFLEPEAEKVRSQLHVRQAAESSGGSREARKLVDANPSDLALQVKLAEALASEGKSREAFDVCLGVITKDRAGVGMAAKTAMLDILNTLSDPDLASEYRRKLASALY